VRHRLDPEPAGLDPAARIGVTAARLAALPPELATSLSVTADWGGLSEGAIRRLASAAAAPLGLVASVDGCAGALAVTFRRARPRR
jgi:hypothetical protein